MVNIFPNGYEVDAKCVSDIVAKAFAPHGIKTDYDVNVNFVSRGEMVKLHDNQDHGVLSFPLEAEPGPDGIIRYGDIVVLGSLPPNKRDELIAHSCLHLLGIHHERKDDKPKTRNSKKDFYQALLDLSKKPCNLR